MTQAGQIYFNAKDSQWAGESSNRADYPFSKEKWQSQTEDWLCMWLPG